MDVEEGFVQGVQDLAQGALDRQELPSEIGADTQVHIAAGHLGQGAVDFINVFFQLLLGLMD